MNLSRVVILGLLAERDELHGHQIRRSVDLTNARAWGGITGGALYSALHRLADEGLIEAVREEMIGNRPPRVVYRITDEGRTELVVQRDQALESVFDSADPIAVVVLFAVGQDPSELVARLSARRLVIQSRLEALRSEREYLTAGGHLDWRAIAAFRRGETRLAAELAWHAEIERAVPGGVTS